MKIKINYELDTIYETMGLLYVTYNPDFLNREVFLKEALEIGLNEASIVALYEKMKPLLEQYITAFQEQMVKSEVNLFYFKTDEELEQSLIFRIFVIVTLNNRHWLETLDSIDDSIIYEAMVRDLLGEVPKTTQELISKLKMEKYSPQVCWNLLLILESPKSYLEQWIQMIQSHIPACEYAQEVLEDTITSLLTNFKQPSSVLLELVESFVGEELQVWPSLIWSMSFNLLREDLAYSGLLMGEVAKILDRKHNPEQVAQGFKVLGDQSKLEILKFLKEGPKYNVEIANKLGVTAATTSHHMNVLVTHGFVKLLKQGNKVYYSLEEERITEAIADLKSILL